MGGWDTYVNQGFSTGQIARNLQKLGTGLATLVQGLGSVYNDTTVLVMSNFGWTFREENGNGGTDHCHGNVMWVLGGNRSTASGLESKQLFEGRDLAVITNF